MTVSYTLVHLRSVLCNNVKIKVELLKKVSDHHILTFCHAFMEFKVLTKILKHRYSSST